eukprot:TRINITY_DN164_c0_g1_i4.p4 TRINITY_DN164_c0_g1~~TRINITY_DN164_c0_g1_i4.p4  ORF type:complete len:69 (-),score=13.36 TRINITY_DN164_c0_g1_i4:207-413(-)
MGINELAYKQRSTSCNGKAEVGSGGNHASNYGVKQMLSLLLSSDSEKILLILTVPRHQEKRLLHEVQI